MRSAESRSIKADGSTSVLLQPTYFRAVLCGGPDCDAAREQSSRPLSGTPAHWCPEQIMGKPQDGRSDLFSLGIVLYELVTRKRPFDADSLQGVCNRILPHEPLPVSHLNTSLPSAFNEVVARCLSKDPNKRHQSGEELANDLYPFARRKVTGQVMGRPIKTPVQSFG